MELQQFEQMLRRHGYSAFFYAAYGYPPKSSDEIALAGLYTRDFRDNHRIRVIGGLFEREEWERASVPEFVYQLDRMVSWRSGTWHHHMACSRCKLPVLKSTNIQDAIKIAQRSCRTLYRWYAGVMTTVPDPAIEASIRDEYRLVSAGPESRALFFCPRCGEALFLSVNEIDDTTEATTTAETQQESPTLEGLLDIWKNSEIIPMTFKPTGETVYVTPQMADYIEKHKKQQKQTQP